MNADHIHDLWARRLAGETLSAADETELAEALADEALRQELLEIESMDGRLRQMGRGEADGDVFVQRLMCSIEAEKSGSKYVKAATARVQAAGSRPRKKSSRRAKKLGGAWNAVVWLSTAAFAILAIGYWQRSIQKDEPRIAILEEATGSIAILHNGATRAVTGKDELRSTDSIHVGADGRGTIVYGDGTRVSLGINARAVVREIGSAKQVELNSGTLTAKVAKQPAGAPMLFVTPQAKATVLGTEFQLKAEAGATRLEVSEGLVRLARAEDAVQYADVAAGEFAVAAPAQELRTQKIQPVQQIAVRRGLSERLVPANGALWGGSLTSAGEPLAQALSSLESHMGRKYGVIHQYHTFADTTGNKEFPTATERTWAKEGRLLLLSWKPRLGPTTLKWSDVAAGKYDAEYVIPTAKKLADFGTKVLFILHHEPDDEVRPAGSGMSASDYTAMWRHVRQRFDEAGAKNVVWVWAVVAGTNESDKWDALYPGDAYVDWLACSAFNFQPKQWRSISEATQRFRDWAVRSRKGDRSKPILLGPIGCVENSEPTPSKELWYRGLPAELATIPEVKGLIYFNGKDVKSASFAIDTSPQALAGYRAAGSDPYFNPDLTPEPKP